MKGRWWAIRTLAAGCVCGAMIATAAADQPQTQPQAKTATAPQDVPDVQTIGPYEATFGCAGQGPEKQYLVVRDKATRRTLLEVKPGNLPAATVPQARPFWTIEEDVCVYGAVKDAQGGLKAFDLSRGRAAYEIGPEVLGPGELHEIRSLGGRLFLAGHVEYKTGWVQLRDPKDGKLIWKADRNELPGWVAQAVLTGRQVVLAGQDPRQRGWIEARDFESGQKLWSARPGSGDYPATLYPAGDRILALTHEDGASTHVVCLDSASGRALWKAAIKPHLNEALVQNGRVLLQRDERAVELDLANGTVLSDTVYEPRGPEGQLTSRPAGTVGGTFTAREKQEMEALMAGWDSHPAMQAISWTMIHCATEAGLARVQALQIPMAAYQEDDIVGFRAAGGAGRIVELLEKLLDDPDPVVRAFAAVSLASGGQQNAKDKIARLMKSPASRPADPEAAGNLVNIDRARAAVALGILGAAEYAPDMAAMLSNKDAGVRGGAALGLGYLKAKQYAQAVSAVLSDEHADTKICAMMAWAQMDARDRAGQIAGLLDDRSDPAVSETACRTLGQLGALDQAPRIAALFKDEYRKREAAKALAVMGAVQYVPDIAALLDSTSSLDRRDACLSLALLNARQHEAAIAHRLDDPEAFVAESAAFALLLLNSTRSPARILDAVDPATFRGLSELRLPKDRQDQLLAAAARRFQALKASAATQPTNPLTPG